jgi:hypothetical protein
MSDKNLYALELNGEQLQVVQRALDLYFRIGMGQITEITAHLIPPNKDVSEWCKRRDIVDSYLRVARRTAMPELSSDNSYYSIHSIEIDESNRIASDIHDVIRYTLAWERKPEGGFGVSWDEPFKRSNRPLPTLRSNKP